MNAYVDSQFVVVRRIQAERRAEAAIDRLAAECRRGQAARRHGQARAGWIRRLAGLPGGRRIGTTGT